MTTAGAPEKGSQIFVEFKYGNPVSPTYLRLTDWTADTVFGSFTFTATPTMSIKGIEITGVLDDKPVQISLELVAGSLQDKLSNGSPHSPVYVTIWERIYSTEGADPVLLVLFKGKIHRGMRNYMGQPSLVMLEAVGQKSRLDVAMGVSANPECWLTFGGRGCGISVPTSTGTMTVISGKAVTITGLTGQPDRTWHRGYVERDGLRIDILDWLSGTGFTLMRRPPDSWLNQTVTVYAGCDKSIARCRYWGNESRFCGFGWATPAYNPLFEGF